MNKVWVVRFTEVERAEQNAVFSTREKANKYVNEIEKYNIFGDIVITDFSLISREEDDFDIYEYLDECGNKQAIFIDEYEIN
jgi:hypothetical protein